MSRYTARDVWNFRGDWAFATTNPNGPWLITDTSSSGTPTYTGRNLGGLSLTLESTSEIQNLCLSFGDVLAYDIDDLLRLEFIAMVGATAIDSTTTITMGMANARADDPEATTTHAFFKMTGSNTMLVSTDDGTNDNSDVATGDTLSTTFKRFAIDFSTGVFSQEPPSTSIGGKGDVKFFMGNARGQLRRVASGTRFRLDAETGGLQPYFQIQKTADTNVDSLTLLQVCVDYQLPV